MLRLTLFGEFSVAGAEGTKIAIKSKKAKGLLAYLALSPRLSRSREEIMALLWSDRAEAQARASLRQVLVGLRKDLGEVATEALVVTNQTVALDPSRITIEAPSQGEELLSGFYLHDPAFEDWLRDERLRHEDANMPSPQPRELPLPDKPSVAVLPFINLNADPAQEYFSDGITEDIITGLSRFRELFVIARNSALTYKSRPVKVQDIGEELGVRYIVEGSVRKSGNRVRITAQLVEAATGNHLWAERYDREAEDVFALQDDVTEIVVATLAGRLGVLGADYIRRKPTQSLTAFDHLLRARQLIYRYKLESILEAQRLLDKAIALDPDYAIAHAWLSETYWAEWLAGWTKDAKATFEQAAGAAAHAVALDDTDPQAHLEMGQICVDRRQYDDGRSHFEKALSLNPNDPNGLMMMSYYSSCVGDPERAITQINDAIRVDPLGHYGFMAGIAHYTARDYEHAIPAFKIVRGDAQGIHAWLAACHAQSGNLGEAHAAANEFVARSAKAMADVGARTPKSWCAFFATRHPYKHHDDMDHLLEGLSKAGLD
jgi:adenylate cyclase